MLTPPSRLTQQFSTANLARRLQEIDFGIEVSKLFCWDKVSENFTQIIDAMGRIEVAQLVDRPTERISFYSIAIAVLALLGSKFMLSTGYKSQHDRKSSNVEIGHIGIGNINTF